MRCYWQQARRCHRADVIVAVTESEERTLSAQLARRRTLDVPENCGINNILQHFASLCGIAVGLHEIPSHRNFVFDAEKTGVADLPDVSSICRLGCLHLLSRNGEVLTYHLQQERMYAQD